MKQNGRLLAISMSLLIGVYTLYVHFIELRIPCNTQITGTLSYIGREVSGKGNRFLRFCLAEYRGVDFIIQGVWLKAVDQRFETTEVGTTLFVSTYESQVNSGRVSRICQLRSADYVFLDASNLSIQQDSSFWFIVFCCTLVLLYCLIQMMLDWHKGGKASKGIFGKRF